MLRSGSGSGAPTPTVALSFDEGEGTIARNAGSGNDAIVRGAEWVGAGKHAGALSFDGTNDRVTVPNDKGSAAGFSVSAWVRPRALSLWSSILTKETGDGGWDHLFYAEGDDGKPSGFMTSGSWDYVVQGSEALALNTWRHVTLTSDGETLRYYVNGELDGSGPSATSRTSRGSIEIGGNTIWGEYFDGLIDDVRVYDEPIDGTQVATDRDEGVTEADPPNPVAAFSFDEGSGAFARNAGSGSEGILRGGTWTPNGRHEGAISFDGVDDLLTVPNDSGSPRGFAIGAWVRPRTLSGWNPLVTKEAPGGSWDSVLYAQGDDGKPAGVVTPDGSASTAVAGTSALPLDAWRYISLISDGDTLRLYRDGNLEASTPLGAARSSEGPFQIGGNTIWGEYFDGTIDDLRIYDRPIDDAQVAHDRDTAVSGVDKPAPVVSLSFDEGHGNDVDNSAGENNGQVHGASWSNDGRFGKALTFDGTDDYVSVSGNVGARRGYTLSAWVKPTDIGGGYRTVVAKETGDGSWDHLLYAAGWESRPEGDMTTDGYGYYAVAGQGPLEEDQWHHLTVTSDGANQRLYVDSELVGQGDAGPSRTSSGPLQIGGNELWGEYFEGQIDEVRVYDRPIGPDQVAEDMDERLGEDPDADPTFPAAGAAPTGDDPIRYSYDDAGRLVGVTDPSQGGARYNWDSVGNLVATNRWGEEDLALTGLTPDRGPIGASTTIVGTGFSTTASENTVKFAGEPAEVLEARAGALKVEVPAGATTGTVTVKVGATEEGSPKPFTVTSTGAPNITSITPTVAKEGDPVAVNGTGFDEEASTNSITVNRSLATTDSASATELGIAVPGATGSGRVALSTSRGKATGPDLFIPPPENQVSDVDPTGRIQSGQAKTVSFQQPGKIGILAFDGEAGQWVSFSAASGAVASRLSVRGPDGQELRSGSVNEGGGFVEAVKLPSDGGYSVVVDPDGTATGSIELTGWLTGPAEPVTPSPEGDARTLSFPGPGSLNGVRFEGEEGQPISVKVSDSTLPYGDYWGGYNQVYLRGPNGSTIDSDDLQGDTLLEPPTLPVDGTYTVMIDPRGNHTGQVKTTVFEVPEVAEEELDPSGSGDSGTVSLQTPGQKGRFTFDGEAGQWVSFSAASGALASRLSVRGPDGQELGNGSVAGHGGHVDAVKLPSDGGYSVVVDPEGSATGSIELTGWLTGPAELIEPSTEGVARTLSLPGPGSVNGVRFEGEEGQRISVKVSDSTLPYGDYWGGYNRVYLRGPNGSTIDSDDLQGDTLLEPPALPADGTYTVEIDPRGNHTGQVKTTVFEVPEVAEEELEPSGSGDSGTLSLQTPGQKGRFTFDGEAGQWVSFSAGSGAVAAQLSVRGPDGQQLAWGSVAGHGGIVEAVKLPSDGSYSVVVDPDGLATGSVELTAWLTGPAELVSPSAGGVARTLSLPGAGSVNGVRFEGEEGKRISVKLSDSTIPSGDGWASNRVSLVGPNGSTVDSQTFYGPSSETLFEPPALAADGTYTIVIDPARDYTGNIKATVFDVPEVAEEELEPSGTGDSGTLGLQTPGQKGRFTFDGEAGQWVSFSAANGAVAAQLSVRKADGQELRSGPVNGDGGFVEAVKLPSDGSYSVVVDPEGAATGSIELTGWLTGPAELIEPSTEGVARTLSLPGPGSVNGVRFEGEEGQRISVELADSTIPSGDGWASNRVALVGPNGSTVDYEDFYGPGSETLFEPPALAADGTYTIVIDPARHHTGNIKATVSLEATSPATYRGAAFDRRLVIIRQATFARPSFHYASVTQRSNGSPARQRPTGRSTRLLKSRSSKQAQRASRRDKASTRRAGVSGRKRAERRRSQLSGPRKAAEVRRTRTQAHKRAKKNGLSLPRATDPPTWKPRSIREGWFARRPESPWQNLKTKRARPGQTALAGQVLKLNGDPLPGARISVDGTKASTRADETGRFLLQGLSAGHRVLVVNGRSAKAKGLRYGIFEVGIDLKRGTTTTLKQTVWMTPLDRAGNKRLPAGRTKRETVLTHPQMPGFEVRIPAGSTVRDRRGRRVRNLNLTPVPLDRTPFGLPHFQVPVYFQLQPGGAYFSKGARVTYPNYMQLAPGQRVDFWNYDPKDRGWHIYGKGRVTKDGKQMVPDPGVRIWDFTGAMASSGPTPPDRGPNGGGEGGGDPVDLASGLFVYEKTDLRVNDVIPAAVKRTYRPRNLNSYSFGVGTTSSYDTVMWSDGSNNAYYVTPDGGRIRLRQTSPSGNYWVADANPGPFFGARVMRDSYDGSMTMRLRDGTTHEFSNFGPLRRIRTRTGQELRITRANGGTGRVEQVTTEHGRWVKFEYDSYSRVTRARDNAGRAATYTYDVTGRLASATNPRGHTTHYTYVDGRMTEVKDNRGITFLKNTYDSQDRVIRQEQADGSEFLFSYENNSQVGNCAAGGSQVFCAGINEATTVTDPGGTKRRVEFDLDGYSTKDIADFQGSKQRETAYTRDGDTNLVERVTDPLGRKTDLSYDSAGKVTQRTDAADSDAAATTEYAYESRFGLIKTATDAAGRDLKWERDDKGRVTKSVLPSGRATTFQYDGSEDQPSSVTDAAGATTTIEYERGLPALIRDPLGRTTRLLTDPVGRMVAGTDPEGRTTKVTYDEADQPTKRIAPDGATTGFTYDSNGNLTKVTNANGKERSATYDVMNRIATQTDPLGRSESFDYDADGNPTKRVDRKGQTTVLEYDALGRQTKTRFGADSQGGQQSLISYSYDDADRLFSVQDSEAGNFGFSWDARDRLTSETSASNGTVTYGYDAADRRTSMQAPGVGSTTYSYDQDDRLTGVTRGGQSVSLGYDQAGRRSSLTLPGGVTQAYSYDAASQLTRIGYANGAGSLGEIRYGYDAAGRRDAMWGDAARTLLPPDRGPMSYDDADQLTGVAGDSITYDANGQVTGQAGRTYGWDARGQLTSITGDDKPASVFTYDPFGRRMSRSVDSEETTYTYEGENVLTEQRSGGGQISLLNGLAMDERFARTGEGDTQAFLTDAVGSTMHLAGADGEPATSYAYDPFGRTARSGDESDNAFQYTGRENEGGGLQYNRARYYNSTAGRFLSEDPIGLAGGDANVHAYTSGDPVNLVDPNGLFSLDPLLDPMNYSEIAAGAVDTITFGGMSKVWGVNSACFDSSYQVGYWGSMAFGVGRLTYAGLAKLSSRRATKVGTKDAALGASAYRDTIKVGARGGAFPNFRTMDPLIRLDRLGGDYQKLARKAGQTNGGLNVTSGMSVTGGTYNHITGPKGCG